METQITHETVVAMLQDLGIDPMYTSHGLRILAESNSKYLKDMKLNVSTTLNSSNLTKKEAYLLALATAVNEKNNTLIASFEQLARKEGATTEELAETHACTSLLALNNVFYRFRHFMHDVEFYNKQSAGLRMSIMMSPVLGKEFFELMSLAVSALNGCERCVTSHEHSVKEHGATEQRVYDAMRLVSSIKGLCIVI